MEKMKYVFGGPMLPADALPFARRSELLTDENPGNRIGYTVMPDGTGYVSDITCMPGVTAEMLDWYIAWRGEDPDRYRIINPKEHISAVSMQRGKSADEDLIGAEKYWDTTQIVVRLSEMGPKTEYVNFKCPSDVGFDPDMLKDSSTAGMICAGGYAQGLPPMAGPDYFVCHQIVNVEGGVEVRSKYWIGWTVRYGRDYKQLPDNFYMPPVFAMEMLLQNRKEWENLGAVLPGLYEEETKKQGGAEQ